MSRINVENIRHPDASSDSLQLSDTGNITAPGNLSVTGTSTLTDDLNVDSGTLFVDVSADRVGIGTSTPSSHLHIRANTPALAFQPTADTQENQILFRNAANDATPGRIAYDHNTDQMLFSTNSNQRLRILSDGALQLVNSTGIDFSQIQTNATGMTSETLDSYEEGTWTPTDASGGSQNALTTDGRYTRVGNLLFCTFDIEYPTTADTSTARIGGLPFSASTTNLQGAGSIAWTNFGSALTFYMGSSSTSFTFLNLSSVARTNAQMSAKRIIGAITVRIA